MGGMEEEGAMTIQEGGGGLKDNNDVEGEEDSIILLFLPIIDRRPVVREGLVGFLFASNRKQDMSSCRQWGDWQKGGWILLGGPGTVSRLRCLMY